MRALDFCCCKSAFLIIFGLTIRCVTFIVGVGLLIALSINLFTIGAATVVIARAFGGRRGIIAGIASLTRLAIMRNQSPAELKFTGTPGGTLLNICLYNLRNVRSTCGAVTAKLMMVELSEVGIDSMSWRMSNVNVCSLLANCDDMTPGQLRGDHVVCDGYWVVVERLNNTLLLRIPALRMMFWAINGEN